MIDRRRDRMHWLGRMYAALCNGYQRLNFPQGPAFLLQSGLAHRRGHLPASNRLVNLVDGLESAPSVDELIRLVVPYVRYRHATASSLLTHAETGLPCSLLLLRWATDKMAV